MKASLRCTALVAGLSGCAGIRQVAAPAGYQLAVRNETGAPLAVEYCADGGACAPLGDLKADEATTFTVPASAAEPRYGSRILVSGREYFADGAFRQRALVPVYLRGAEPIPVTLAPTR